MRCDTPIYFQTLRTVYNKITGNYEEGEPVEVLRYADVTDTSAQTQQFVYGSVKQGSYTLRLNYYHNQPFDCIRIGNKRYKVDSQRMLQHKQIFVVSEV